MIDEIRIRDLGVITQASLQLDPGFNVVTGETGAGKTMVVTALGLLLGSRSDAGSVRTGAKAAVAESIVRIPARGSVAERVLEAGAELENETDGVADLTLVRTVNADGRSRAHVGGRTAPVGVLGEIGSSLVAVHGQSDQLRLRSASAQRDALDKFAGRKLREVLGDYAEDFRRWKDATAELEALKRDSRERLREAESLRQALEEIDGVDPQPGEDEALKAVAMRLGNTEELREAAENAHQKLVAGEFPDASDATSLVEEARRHLELVSEHDPALDEATRRLSETSIILTDIAAELASYTASLDADGPGRLAEVDARRSELSILIRKYAPSIDEVLQWSTTARSRLEELTEDGSRIEELEHELATVHAALIHRAAEATAIRTDAARELESRISAELSALAMPDASLHVQLSSSAELTAYGQDEVTLALAPHAGTTPRPLGKGASGGELSRVMLAIEVVLAEVDPVPTFVFDEVDAGVGGKAAVEIGRRLAMLAKHVQVIVVTHLPQVAAFADRHVRVIKTSGGGSDGVTASDVVTLDRAERVKELARMLAGQEDSATARAHAEELLEDAAGFASAKTVAR
ncbi:DNA repair protein RecN [Arthrobacter roseus]|uniref:DNA repair protein RecN n=1 Tax=Arthrobacter roseus TaxID=136274 RepID=UPI0019630973|nr:DNA repair protein RecN (Recombination protein N) [Arthrobacter roseus]